MRTTQFENEVRASAKKLWDAHQELSALRKEADAGDYGAQLVLPGDDENGTRKAAVLAVAYATNDAIAALMNGGHATNVVKVL